MNTVLMEFQNFAPKPEVFEMGGNLELQNGLNLVCGYVQVANVQNDPCFGLSLILFTIFKIYSQFS